MRRIFLFFLFSFFLESLLFAEKPELLLLNTYKKDMNVTGWYMSEKLDGVRAYWNGKELISRNGKVFSTPSFFTKDFPKMELDGELWSKRGDFANIISVTHKRKPHNGWKSLTYNVFDVPHVEGDLQQRLSKVSESQYIRVLKQIKIVSKEALYAFLKEVEDKNGEGVVIRNGFLPYSSGRTNNALKLKNYQDEECEVIKINRGKGKNSEQMGSLLCRLKNGKSFKLGSGFSQDERKNPPKVGAIITFKYYGLTSKGNPRFPIFMRIRE